MDYICSVIEVIYEEFYTPYLLILSVIGYSYSSFCYAQ